MVARWQEKNIWSSTLIHLKGWWWHWWQWSLHWWQYCSYWVCRFELLGFFLQNYIVCLTKRNGATKEVYSTYTYLYNIAYFMQLPHSELYMLMMYVCKELFAWFRKKRNLNRNRIFPQLVSVLEAFIWALCQAQSFSHVISFSLPWVDTWCAAAV